MSSPETSDMIRQELGKRADGGEPLFDADRSLFDQGGSIGVTLTAHGRDTHDMQSGEDVNVEVHPDGIWISPEVDDE